VTPPRDPDPDPRTVRDVLITWRRRAEDREMKTARSSPDFCERRILAAAAAEIRQCIAELEHADRWE
jgi:hypothetical protein